MNEYSIFEKLPAVCVGCDKGYCNRELIRQETDEATIRVYIIILMPCAVFTPDNSMKSVLEDGSKVVT